MQVLLTQPGKCPAPVNLDRSFERPRGEYPLEPWQAYVEADFTTDKGHRGVSSIVWALCNA